MINSENDGNNYYEDTNNGTNDRDDYNGGKFARRDAQHVCKLRGLPFSATKDDVLQFMQGNTIFGYCPFLSVL